MDEQQQASEGKFLLGQAVVGETQMKDSDPVLWFAGAFICLWIAYLFLSAAYGKKNKKDG